MNYKIILPLLHCAVILVAGHYAVRLASGEVHNCASKLSATLLAVQIG